MLSLGWTDVVAVVAAYLIAALTAPAGISGAVLLLPFQVSVLGTPSPAVTPTNLLYNVIATPGALYRYWRQGQTGGRLALLLIAGTVPGVIAGSVIRVELLPGPRVFDLVVAAALVPLGSWLTVTRPASVGNCGRPARPIPGPRAARPGGRGGLRRRHLRDRRRVDPSTHPDRHRAQAIQGRPGRPGIHARDVGRGRDHLRYLVDPRTRPGGPGLGYRHRWVSAAWPAPTPERACSPICPTP